MAEQFFRVRKGLTVANSTASANLDPITLTIGATVVNTTVVNVATVLATTVNATTVNAETHQVGTSTIANSTGVYTGIVNAATHQVGTSTIANSTGVYTGIVNAATHQVGTVYTANATLVNAAAVNSRGQVNTVTLFATTSANVGGNVQLTTVHLSVGNTIANLIANSIVVKVANSSGTANLQPTQLVIGTSVINSTSINAAAIYYGGAQVARLSTEDQVVSGGASVTEKDLGTITSGTLTPDPGDRPMQRYINGGSHTLAPGAVTGCYILTITNNASAVIPNTTGWTKVDGDTFTTTNGHKFRCHCSIGAAGSVLSVQAMQ